MAESIPKRRRVSYPEVDATTEDWWNAQDDASVSIRLLIRADVERNGYTDVMNRPVVQLPRRGRPPASERTSEQDDEASAMGEAEEAPAVASTSMAPVATSAKKKTAATAQAAQKKTESSDPAEAESSEEDHSAEEQALTDLLS